MSRKIIVLSKNLSKHWFILSFFIIALVVFFVSFFKVLELKDFNLELPENCDSAYNTCFKNGEESTPSRFILLKESYFSKNCENKDFDECLKGCSENNQCALETKTDENN